MDAATERSELFWTSRPNADDHYSENRFVRHHPQAISDDSQQKNANGWSLSYCQTQGSSDTEWTSLCVRLYIHRHVEGGHQPPECWRYPDSWCVERSSSPDIETDSSQSKSSKSPNSLIIRSVLVVMITLQFFNYAICHVTNKEDSERMLLFQPPDKQNICCK